MSGRITLEDIAKAAGASVASVSLALRNKPGVSRARREQIFRAARELGYAREAPLEPAEVSTARRVTILFRSLTTGPAAPLMDPFTSWVVTGIQEAMQEDDIDLMMAAIRWDPETGQVEFPPDRLLGPRQDAVLVLGSYPDDALARILDHIAGRGYPVVNVDGARARALIDCVGTANFDGAREATRYLINRGHRRIAFAGRLSRRIPSFEDRHRGYREEMVAIGAESFQIDIRGETTTEPAINLGLPYTAIVAGNDYDAAIMLRLHQAAGLRVPEDLSIVGFDDTNHASQAHPALSTMRIDMLAMGRLAVEALRFRWRWPEAAPLMISLQPVLVERGSVSTIGEGRSPGA